MHEPTLFADCDAPAALAAEGARSAAGSRAAAAERWRTLADSAGIAPGEPLLVALSGGSDSVLLLELARSADPSHPLLAVHVDHGLRGEESAEDARFCERLCGELGVPFALRRVELDPAKPGLEQRARAARYRALALEARASGHRTIVTAHHANDALETLLLRWTRGTRASGLAGLAARRTVRGAPGISVVRPLLSLRKAEVEAWLAESGLPHREDSSNADLDFARNRLRRRLLPAVEGALGREGLENLFAFAEAVRDLEGTLARASAHLAWTELAHAGALGTRGGRRSLRVARSALMQLSPLVRKRALERLLIAGTAVAPGRELLDRLAGDLGHGRCARHALAGGWSLHLRAAELVLEPPREPAPPAEPLGRSLPFPAPGAPPAEFRLPLPGVVQLADGRRVAAHVLRPRAPRSVPREDCAVELDLSAVPDPRALRVRFPRAGDRFHALGAPGSKPLSRFLADCGIPRGDRPHVPLVTCGERIVWVAGVRPAEGLRTLPQTAQRLRLELYSP